MTPERIAYINGFLVLSAGNETLLRGETEYIVGFPMVYPFKWGFIGVKNSTLCACTYSGQSLWEYSLPRNFRASASENHLFVFVPSNAPQGIQANDTLYVLGKTGLVRKFDFPNIYYPSRCGFLKSRGNYTLFLLDQPQADGTAGIGRVLLFRGLEITFNRTFTFRDSIEDPVHCVGDVSSSGLAAFGLYGGVGIFNGNLKYVELSSRVDDIAIAESSVFALVSRETPNFVVVKELLLVEESPKVLMENLSESAELFSSKDRLLLVDPTAERVYLFSSEGELLKTLEYSGEAVVEGDMLLLCNDGCCTPVN
ncbi:MAG: hypothetical protein ABGW50_00485 [Thermococcus sp.]